MAVLLWDLGLISNQKSLGCLSFKEILIAQGRGAGFVSSPAVLVSVLEAGCDRVVDGGGGVEGSALW